jgi:hypothetical protein
MRLFFYYIVIFNVLINYFRVVVQKMDPVFPGLQKSLEHIVNIIKVYFASVWFLLL